MEGITDAMRQYSRATEDIYMNKPKRIKPFGIRRPSSDRLVSALAALFTVIVLAAEFMS